MDNKNLKELARLVLYNRSYFLSSPLINPEVLQISITNRCNLKCKFCSIHKYTTSEEEEIGLKDIKNIITIAKNQFDIKELILTGGEPLLLGDDIVRISEFAHKKNIRIILTTNGFLLQKYARSLAEAGISHFHISIDGLKNTHNYLRNNPESFSRAVESIKYLVKIRHMYSYNYSVGIAMLMLKSNINQIYELYKYADSLGVDIFELLYYLPDNTEFSVTDQTFLWPDSNDMDKFNHIYKKIIETKTENIQFDKYFDIDLVCRYYKRIMHHEDWKCFAGFKNFFITMSDPKKQGRFEPCLFMCKAHIPLKDYDYDLKRAWYSDQAHKARIAIKKCQVYCYQKCFSLPLFEKAQRVNNNFLKSFDLFFENYNFKNGRQ